MITLSDQAHALSVIDNELTKMVNELKEVQRTIESAKAHEANLKTTIAALKEVGAALLGV